MSEKLGKNIKKEIDEHFAKKGVFFDAQHFAEKDRQKTIEYNLLVKENRFLREVIEQAEMDMGVMIDCMSKHDKHLCNECRDRLSRALKAGESWR